MIEIRQLDRFDLPIVWRWLDQFRSQYADEVVPATYDEWEANFASGSWLLLAVMNMNLLAGCIAVQQNGHIATGHAIFSRHHWGRAVTDTAIRMVADGLFKIGVKKIVLPCLGGNQRAHGLYRRLGAIQEAYLNRHILRGGVPADAELWALFPEGEKPKQWDGARQSDHSQVALSVASEPKTKAQPKPVTATRHSRTKSKAKQPVASAKP